VERKIMRKEITEDLIFTETGQGLLVDRTVMIKNGSGDYFYDGNHVSQEGKSDLDAEAINFYGGLKVIASCNPHIPNTNEIEMVDEVEEEAKKQYPDLHNKMFASDATANVLTKLCRSAFLKGREGMFTLEQMRLCWNYAGNWFDEDHSAIVGFDNFIESISKPQYLIEVKKVYPSTDIPNGQDMSEIKYEPIVTDNKLKIYKSWQ
jgi:hypothetical protein